MPHNLEQVNPVKLLVSCNQEMKNILDGVHSRPQKSNRKGNHFYNDVLWCRKCSRVFKNPEWVWQALMVHHYIALNHNNLKTIYEENGIVDKRERDNNDEI